MSEVASSRQTITAFLDRAHLAEYDWIKATPVIKEGDFMFIQQSVR
jgi:hypothetical protein